MYLAGFGRNSESCPKANIGNTCLFMQVCIFYDLTSNGLFFTDSTRGKVCFHKDATHSVIAGNGQRKRADGQGSLSSLAQPTGIVLEGETIFVTDTAVGSVRMITGISGTVQYLHMLHDLSSSFGLHLHG